MRRFELLAALALALSTATASACGAGAKARHTEAPASAAVEEYLQALRDDDPKAAWAMLSGDARQGLSFDDFEESWREATTERAHQIRSLEEEFRASEDLGERARVKYADGKAVSLYREGGAWRLEAGLVSRSHASGPRDAIQLFADALAERSYEGLLRILTDRRRQAIRKHVEEFVTSLEAHLGDKIAHIGEDRAELRWDDEGKRYKVILRKEDGEWRIDDVDVRPEPTEDPDPDRLSD